jgi:heptosyltransferase-2
VGVNPGAEYGPAKRWPIENYLAAAREIHRRTGCGWLVLGGANDARAAGKLEASLSCSKAPVVNLAGRTSLRELCAVLKVCRLVLTNDTGPMHLAAALGTPVVAPFGSTSPELTGPGLPGNDLHRVITAGVPCSPCFRRTCPIDFRCMTQISPRDVVQQALQVLH